MRNGNGCNGHSAVFNERGVVIASHYGGCFTEIRSHSRHYGCYNETFSSYGCGQER